MLTLFAWCTLLLAACGGGGGGGGVAGGGGSTVSGTASAGAPLIGYARLKDSASPTTTLEQKIAADGSFSFDVAGLTAPFCLWAEGNVGGTSYNLHSYTTGPGTANINPLTDLAVAAAANVNNPADVWNNPVAHLITQVNLDQAIADIRALLQPLITVHNATGNFLSDNLPTDHSSWDGLVDVVDIEINHNTGTVTITDRAAGGQIGQAAINNLANGNDLINSTEANQTTAVPTDLQQIEAMLVNFVNALNLGANLTAQDLDPFFANNFGIDYGWDRATAINDFLVHNVAQFRGITSISNIALLETLANGDYHVGLVVLFADGSMMGPSGGLVVTNENNTWKMTGNGFKSRGEFDAECIRWENTDGTTTEECGFYAQIDNNGGFDLQTAIITGPGLPQGGLTLSDPPGGDNNLYLDAQCTTCPTHEGLYVLDDATIGQIPDNATYTMKIFDSNGLLVETQTKILPKPPFKRSDLTNDHFLNPGGITSHNIAALPIGGDLTFTYTLPSAYQAASANAGIQFWGAGNNWGQWQSLYLNQSAATINIPAPNWLPTGGLAEVWVTDIFRREMRQVWMLDSQG